MNFSSGAKKAALSTRKQLQNVPVGIAKINSATPFPRIQLPILPAPRVTAPRDSRFLHALEDSVELLVAHMKRIVMPLERLSIVEVQGKLTVDPNRSKVAHRPIVFQTENLRKKTRRGFLVTRRHNSMIQCDRHDC